MAQKSKIEQLPRELLDTVNQLLEKATIEQVVDRMKAFGVELSMSSVGRHKQKIDVVARRLRDSRVIADAIGKRIEDQPDDRMAALNRELLHEQVMRMLTATEDDEPVQLAAKDVRSLADSMARLASASKTDAERVFKVRKETADKTIAAANDQLKKSGQPGMSAETVATIKEQIWGSPGEPGKHLPARRHSAQRRGMETPPP